MRKMMSIVTIAILISGIIHMLLTSTFHGAPLTVTDIWFASFGLALVFLAFLNYILMKSEVKSSTFFVFGHVANLSTTLLIAVLLTRALYPHIILLFGLLVIEATLLFYAQLSAPRRQRERTREDKQRHASHH